MPGRFAGKSRLTGSLGFPPLVPEEKFGDKVRGGELSLP